MRLVMTILVKNEIDIIEDNIRFHSVQGVDAFLVMDNGSTDGTVERLESLKQIFDITIVINLGLYDQGPWMTQLAKQSKKELGADLVISNDADEFWSDKSGNLKHSLSRQESIITVKRFNFVQSLDDMNNNTPYYETPYKVTCPILYSKEDQVEKAGLAIPLSKISPKVIVNPYGLQKIKGGNHRAKHVLFWRNRASSSIEVHHYPIRSYAQFEKNIQNRKSLLDADKNTRMGVHYKRWVTMLEQGDLQHEFERMSLNQDKIIMLQSLGVIDAALTPLHTWKKQL